jgi:predicted N-acetyltransferase YhbS
MSITYRSDVRIAVDDFIDVLSRSTLGERRPIHDKERMQKMLDHANVIVTAWSDNLLVGISRAVSDFSFCCYLSDLAVDVNFQHQGIGKELIKRTHEAAGFETQLILLAAPKAVNYYPRIGMKRFEHCFVEDRKV